MTRPSAPFRSATTERSARADPSTQRLGRFATVTRLAPLLAVVGILIAVAKAVAAPQAAFPPVEPSTVGVRAEALQRLSATVQSFLDGDEIVGAELLVIKDRRTVLHEVFGWRDREADLRMVPNTLFNIRSMTKPITGAAVQILVDQGRLRLDDRVSKHLPAFDTDGSREITVRQLLTHTSGLPLTVVLSVNQYEDLQALAAAAGERGPEYPPGSRYWYSDAGTDVLGALVEKVSGLPLQEFRREQLLDPLGMKDTFVPLDPTDTRWERLATTYMGQPGSWFAFWKPERGPFYPFAWGSQSLSSTPADYAKFLAMWMDAGMAGDTRVLSPAAVERTLAPVSEATGMGSEERVPTSFTGLEVFYGQMAFLWAEHRHAEPRVLGHSGSDGTFAWAWPEEDLMVLYFTQSRGSISGLTLERWIEDLLIPGERTTGIGSAAEADLAGEYLADFGSLRDTTLTVTIRNGVPVLDLGRGRRIELRDPDEEGRWTLALSGKTRVSFDRGDEGKVLALRLHEGDWTFEAPRRGVGPDEAPDLAGLEEYLGTYRVEEGLPSGAESGEIEVLIRRNRLTLDTSGLPVDLPADGFALHRPSDPDVEGMPVRWVYRANPRLAVEFVREDGEVAALRLFEDGQLELTARRVDAPSP